MSSCAICLEPEMTSPAACVPCGHTFCLSCITQWTRSPPRFGLSLCPQCRSPVREVQKLFISDWPVSGGGSSGVGGGPTAPIQLSAWQQLQQLATLFLHFVAIPLHSLAQYGPEMGRRVNGWLERQAQQMIVLRDRLIRCAAVCGQEWRDLGLGAQCAVGAAAALVLLLLAQDLHDHQGIHRGVVLPVLLLLVDIVSHLLFVVAFLLYRPLACLLACGLEVGLAAVDVVSVVLSSLLWVAWDVVRVPWLAACVACRAAWWGVGVVAGMVRVVMLCAVLALSLGLPALLAAPEDAPLRRQLPELLQAGLEGLRNLVLRHTPQPPQPAAGVAPPARRPHRHPPRDFLRLLLEEVRNASRWEREGRVQGEEGERGQAPPPQPPQRGEEGASASASSTAGGERLEVR